MSRLSLATRDVVYQQEIIRDLTFKDFQSRQQGISEAHNETCGWALEEDDRRSDSQERLARWLVTQTAEGPFWVSGKPGSGKSTFMKYVVRSGKTIDKLNRWAPGHPIIIASHCLWCRGLPVQRSLYGLLRTLLLDIFRQHPGLITQVINANEYSSSRRDAAKRMVWDIPQLRSTLNRLAFGESLEVKFCIFIDGLDEFDGDHLELSQYLIQILNSSSVKLCVSSRPWNVFEDLFGNSMSTKLYMHELNEGDISRYTRSQLFGHHRWNLLLVEHADACRLVDEITERARGVFLWVFLVTKMLREGLTNHESFTDLRKRLCTFPSDLHDFFRNIIESVDPIYQERAAGCLQLAQTAINPLETLIYYFHDVQYDGQAHAPHRYSKFGGLEEEYNKTLKMYTLRRINAYCRGLLESRCGKVVFLHRTVADFLDTGEMVQLLAEKGRSDYDPLVSILESITCLLETQRAEPAWFQENMKMAVAYAALVEKRNDRSSAIRAYCLLDKICGYLPLSVDSYTACTLPDFINPAIQAHLHGYLQFCLQRHPAYCDCLWPDVINVTLESPDCPMKEGLLDMFFKHEQSRDTTDAIQPSRVTKSWVTFITRVTTNRKETPGSYVRDLAGNPGLCRRFLEHGADPNALMPAEIESPFHCSTAWVEFFKPSLVVRLSDAEQQMHLDTLDILIYHGARFLESPMGVQIYSLLVAEPQEGSFYERNAMMGRNTTKSSKSEPEFIANVMMRFFSIADGDISRFWPALGMLLGADLVESMKADYRTATDDRDQSAVIGKTGRSRSTSPGGVEARKKRRKLAIMDPSNGQQGFLTTTPPWPSRAVRTTGSGTVDDPVSIDDDLD